MHAEAVAGSSRGLFRRITVISRDAEARGRRDAIHLVAMTLFFPSPPSLSFALRKHRFRCLLINARSSSLKCWRIESVHRQREKHRFEVNSNVDRRSINPLMIETSIVARMQTVSVEELELSLSRRESLSRYEEIASPSPISSLFSPGHLLIGYPLLLVRACKRFGRLAFMDSRLYESVSTR